MIESRTNPLLRLTSAPAHLRLLYLDLELFALGLDGRTERWLTGDYVAFGWQRRIIVAVRCRRDFLRVNVHPTDNRGAQRMYDLKLLGSLEGLKRVSDPKTREAFILRTPDDLERLKPLVCKAFAASQ